MLRNCRYLYLDLLTAIHIDMFTLELFAVSEDNRSIDSGLGYLNQLPANVIRNII